MFDNAMDDIELSEERYDEVGGEGEWPSEKLYGDYALHQLWEDKVNEASRTYRHGIGRYPESGSLLFGVAILLHLRRNETG